MHLKPKKDNLPIDVYDWIVLGAVHKNIAHVLNILIGQKNVRRVAKYNIEYTIKSIPFSILRLISRHFSMRSILILLHDATLNKYSNEIQPM